MAQGCRKRDIKACNRPRDAMLVRPVQMTDLQAGYVALEQHCQAIEGEREQYEGAQQSARWRPARWQAPAMSPSILQLTKRLSTMHGLPAIHPPRVCALTRDGAHLIMESLRHVHGNRGTTHFGHRYGMMITSISVHTLSPPSPIGGQHPQALLHVLSCWCLAHAALVQSKVLTPFSAYAVLSRPDASGGPEIHVFI